MSTYGFLLYWSIQYFSLEINWEKRLLDSKVGMSQPGPRGLLAHCPHSPVAAPGLLQPQWLLGQEGLLSDPVGFPSLQPSPITSSRRGCGR